MTNSSDLCGDAIEHILDIGGFSFKVDKSGDIPKLTISVNEDIPDLSIEVRTGGRIIGVNTFVTTLT